MPYSRKKCAGMERGGGGAEGQGGDCHKGSCLLQKIARLAGVKGVFDGMQLSAMLQVVMSR